MLGNTLPTFRTPFRLRPGRWAPSIWGSHGPGLLTPAHGFLPLTCSPARGQSRGTTYCLVIHWQPSVTSATLPDSNASGSLSRDNRRVSPVLSPYAYTPVGTLPRRSSRNPRNPPTSQGSPTAQTARSLETTGFDSRRPPAPMTFWSPVPRCSRTMSDSPSVRKRCPVVGPGGAAWLGRSPSRSIRIVQPHHRVAVYGGRLFPPGRHRHRNFQVASRSYA